MNGRAAYAVFGGRLDSDLEFPELTPSIVHAPGWRLRVDDDGPPPVATVACGIETLPGAVHVRLTRGADRLRLAYDDTGTFDVLDGGRTIVWYRSGDGAEAAARIDILSRVLALALHAAGRLCLHGSGVAIDGAGVGFLAPKGSGKSTLAVALAAAGGRLLSDDVIPVAPGPPAMVGPGVHSVRLWRDSIDHLALAHTAGDADRGKHLLCTLDAASLATDAVPLAALYVLVPRRAGAGDAAAMRHPLTPVAAALALVQHAKLGALATGPEGALVLERATAIARTVPVHALGVVHDFARLPEVIASLHRWHRDAAHA